MQRDLLVVGVATAVSVLLLAAGIAAVDGNARLLMADPAAYTHQPPYLGAVSQVGVMLWFCGAAVAGFATWMRPGASSDLRGMLVVLAWLSLCLGVDDLFMLHESVGPRDLHLPQSVFVLVYAGTGAVILVRHWRVLVADHGVLFIAAAALLAGSVGIDGVADHSHYLHGAGAQIAEDGMKFVGIVLWTLHIVAQSARLARSSG